MLQIKDHVETAEDKPEEKTDVDDKEKVLWNK